MSHWSRRRLISAAAGTLAASLVVACGAQATPSPAPPAADADPVGRLEPGQGAILQVDGRKLAVYKDDDGGVTRLSPRCPHQGCEVAWNADESTWDCPCHASRFAAGGARIAGPATTGLEAAE